MELGAFSYFTSNVFWFSTSLALLATFYVGYKYTGMRGDGSGMGQDINFANNENRLKLLSAFLLAEVALNLVLFYGSSVLL